MLKQPTYRIFLFIFILIFLDQSLGRIIHHFSSNYKYDQRIGKLVDQKLKHDILVLGSSRALNGIDPETIKKQTGLSCFNLAFSGSNVVFHETILDLIIDSKNIPKTIIYTIDDPSTLDDTEKNIIYRKEELYPYIYNDLVNTIVTKKLNKTLLITKISPTYHQNINFINALRYMTRGKEIPNYEINNIDSNGANLMLGHQPGKENIHFTDAPNEFIKTSTKYAQSFSNIISKCKKNNINLLLVYPAVLFSSHQKFKVEIKKIVKDDTLILDFSTLLKDPIYFYNHGHLNKKGATFLSEKIGEEINLKFN